MHPFGIISVILLLVIVFATIMAWIQAGKQKRQRDVWSAVATTVIAVVGFWLTFANWTSLLV